MTTGRDIYFYYHGLGDSLLFNSVVFALGKQNKCRYFIGTKHPEIYKGNPHVNLMPFSQNVNYKIGKFLAPIAGFQFHHIDYYHEGRPPKRHILTLLGERVGLTTPLQRPAIFLNEEEQSRRLLPETEKPWVAIQSTGLAKWTDNKNWGVDRFREVVRLLKGKASIVQMGVKGDPSLGVDLELQGKLPIRDVFVVLRQCRAFIGQVGFLMHASAAVGLRSVIVYGGFEAPWQSGYKSNINLYSDVECAPCWLETQCPFEKKCMSVIGPNLVVEKAISILNTDVAMPPMGDA
jgi:ADP-heptose:LPS heptosyltransferase